MRKYIFYTLGTSPNSEQAFTVRFCPCCKCVSLMATWSYQCWHPVGKQGNAKHDIRHGVYLVFIFIILFFSLHSWPMCYWFFCYTVHLINTLWHWSVVCKTKVKVWYLQCLRQSLQDKILDFLNSLNLDLTDPLTCNQVMQWLFLLLLRWNYSTLLPPLAMAAHFNRYQQI